MRRTCASLVAQQTAPAQATRQSLAVIPSITKNLIFALAFLFLSVSAASAQVTGVNNSTSTPIAGAGHDYVKMLNETVDLANGSPSVRIGVPLPKGRGNMLPFYFGYDSNSVHVFLQNPSGSSFWSSDNTPLVSQGGWTYSSPYLSFDSYFKPQVFNSSVTMECWFNKNFLFRDPSGGRHYLGMGWNETSSTYCGPINQLYPQNDLTGGDQFFQSALQTAQTIIPNSTGSNLNYSRF